MMLVYIMRETSKITFYSVFGHTRTQDGVGTLPFIDINKWSRNILSGDIDSTSSIALRLLMWSLCRMDARLGRSVSRMDYFKGLMYRFVSVNHFVL